MTNEVREVGCEEYLYRDAKKIFCCLHPCLIVDCPEAICALDFPGGAKALERYKRVKVLLESGASLDEVAKQLNLSTSAVRRRLSRIGK